MADQIVYVPVEMLERFMIDALVALGVPEEDATICVDVLIASDRRGIESHGIGRFKMYYDRIRAGIQHPVTRYQVVRETPATAVVDGLIRDIKKIRSDDETR